MQKDVIIIAPLDSTTATEEVEAALRQVAVHPPQWVRAIIIHNWQRIWVEEQKSP